LSRDKVRKLLLFGAKNGRFDCFLRSLQGEGFVANLPAYLLACIAGDIIIGKLELWNVNWRLDGEIVVLLASDWPVANKVTSGAFLLSPMCNWIA